MTKGIGWRKPRRLSVVLAIAAVLITVGVVGVATGNNTTIHAHFTSAEGLNVNDDVKVLGVKVGTVTAIENVDDTVRVTLAVDADQPIPADAQAAIVAPSLVSGRFVQLTPVWTGGEQLPDGAIIDVEHTAVPLGFDDVKEQLTDLATALGPVEDMSDGALASTIDSLDRSLRDGNADHLRSALSELRGAATALSDGRSDLFTTIENLDTFTRNLAIHDASVRGFTDELDEVATLLATNRRTLRGALRDLAEVFAVMEEYFSEHGDQLTGSLEELNLLQAAIADRSNELAGVLHVAPHAIINLNNTVENQAITGRATATNFDSAAQLLCGALLGTGASSEQCHEALGPILDLLGLSSPVTGDAP
jgi:phospholipid/cholesterol/gamma-HCH transport system substrate-binding protein